MYKNSLVRLKNQNDRKNFLNSTRISASHIYVAYNSYCYC